MDSYKISTEVFEGPLELLLSLIEKRKLLINDISLATVSEDYLKYIEQHPEFPMAETAQFILTGSTLLLIKSKSLLPVLSLTTDEQDSIADLEMRLKALDVFKTRGRDIANSFGHTPLFSGRRVHRTLNVFSPLKDTTQDNMLRSIESVLNNLPEQKQALTEQTVQRVVSLEEMIDRLTRRVNEGMRISFRQFATNAPEGKVNMIVSFLAMLELVHQGIIRVEQESRCGDIHMHCDTVGVPHYSS